MQGQYQVKSSSNTRKSNIKIETGGIYKDRMGRFVKVCEKHPDGTQFKVGKMHQSLEECVLGNALSSTHHYPCGSFYKYKDSDYDLDPSVNYALNLKQQQSEKETITMTKQMKQLEASIKNNRPALLLGSAGTGKTAMVNQVAEDLGMPVHTLLLSGILPEDMGGLVRPTDNGQGFRYLPPDWALKHGDKPFVLFLDEINQASIQTIHALFYLVNNRQVAGVTLSNMRVIAAGNTADENEFLTPLPAPLLDRFVYKIKWKADLRSALKYLSKKYAHMNGKAEALVEAVKKAGTELTTPRHVEQMLMLIEDGTDDVERGRELVGAAYEEYIKLLQVGERHKEDDRLAELREISAKLKTQSPYQIVEGKMVRVNKEELLQGLTQEEIALVNAA
jgi:MoxR-like ATPase